MDSDGKPIETKNTDNPGSLRGQTVLVTGASGFIGSALCNALRSAGAIVHGISRQNGKVDEGCDRWWQADLADSGQVTRIMESVHPEYIFHLASKVHGGRAVALVPTTFRDNAITTINLLTTATEIGCNRMVLTGSLEESGFEDGVVIPSSPYAAAKHTSNTYGRMFHRLYKTPIVVLRLFMVYGPAQNDRFIVPYVTNSFLKNEPPQVMSGNRLVDWIYIDDVVKAYLAAATTPNITGRTFDIGSGELVPIREVVNRLMDLIQPAAQPNFSPVPERPFEQEPAANIDGNGLLPGWKPLTGLAEGLANTVAWYRDKLMHAVFVWTSVYGEALEMSLILQIE